MKTVEFIESAAGRKRGHIEEIYDETLAQAWVDGKIAKFIRPKKLEAPPVHTAVDSPPAKKAKKPPQGAALRKTGKSKRRKFFGR
jgi:hypothetical protein